MNALLILDMQEGEIQKYDGGLLARINGRIARAVANQELLIYVKNVKKLRSGARTDALAEGLYVCSSHIVCKESASAFSSEDLLDILGENRVVEIEIVGIDGNSCIARTAADARRHGYAVVLPCACIGVKNAERFEGTKRSLAKKGVAVV